MSPPSVPESLRRPSSHSRRSSISTRHSSSNNKPLLGRKHSLPKTPVHINIYDLMPESALASLLWPLGLSLLHTGIVLLDREYAYGASSLPDQTGIFHSPPLLPPPGGTHRLTHLQGFTYLSHGEIRTLLEEASRMFNGERYNLLTNNCNHFTNYMCKVLTGQEMPRWVNRAARVGVVLPCLVPKEWAEMDYDTDDRDSEVGGRAKNDANGAILFYDDDAVDANEAESDGNADERAGMLMLDRRLAAQPQQYYDNPDEVRIQSGEGREKRNVRDTAGRSLPASEVAPLIRLS